MSSVGVLIFFAIVGAFICARSRAAGGAVLFGLIAIVLFISTPVGHGLPGAVSDFVTKVKDVTGPVTQGSAGSGGVG